MSTKNLTFVSLVLSSVHPGNLYTAAPLDRETRKNYTLNISASDYRLLAHSMEGYTIVEITVSDFNDNAPVIYGVMDLTISEGEIPGSFVGQVMASDLDEGSNSVVTFKLQNNNLVPFALNASGFLLTDQTLDREQQEVYTVTITAQDHGHPSRSSNATVTIRISDINDHPPNFEQEIYMISIVEMLPVGTIIFYPRAFDLDADKNARISYYLNSVNVAAEEYFSMSLQTGVVSIAKPIDRLQLLMLGLLNALNDTALSLTLTAEDQGQPKLTGEAIAYVKVDEVSDESLQFVNSNYRVELLEELPAGKLFKITSLKQRF